MRVLPDNPHQGFLRQQAKDMLAGLRESNPTASLTDAQRTLARQYGVDSWAALRVQVQQQRRRPPSLPDGLPEALATAFDLGAVTSMRPVTYRPHGRIWSLTTARGRWLAVPGYAWMSDQHAESGEKLHAAAAAGVTAPTPRRSRDGQLIESISGIPWRITDWMELGPCPTIPIRATVARRIGEIAGTLHALAIPSDAPINSHLTHRPAEDDWDQLLHRVRAAGRPWSEQLAELLPLFTDLRAIGVTAPTDDLILCHCNLIPENVRLGPGDDVLVLEWTFTGSLTAELEVASLLTHWAAHGGLNPVAAKAFAEGYVDHAGTFPPLTLDSFGVAISAYLNWTYHTLCRAIDSTDSDGAAFAERETADLLDHPLTPTTLRQLVDAATASSI